MFSDIQFEFLEFNPEQEMNDFLSAAAERIYASAPSDSAMKIAIKKGKDAVQASCRIVSQAGTFVAEAAGKNPFKAVLQIERKIRLQLDRWRDRRFAECSGTKFRSKNSFSEMAYESF